jgi:hypothetical protein
MEMDGLFMDFQMSYTEWSRGFFWALMKNGIKKIRIKARFMGRELN